MEQLYLNALRRVLESGEVKNDRTGVGTRSVFGHTMEFDLQEGFPLLTTKRMAKKAMVDELLWFISGSTNVNDLNSKIWNEWADEDGDLGPVYGAQLRGRYLGQRFGPDQLLQFIDGIKNNPHSRRHIINLWNPPMIPRMNLPPCHGLIIQGYVRQDQFLDLQMYQRSADAFLGLPFNIASYSTLVHMVAQVTGYEPGRFIHTIGDLHIYSNHMDQVEEQLSRDPYPPPQLKLNSGVQDIEEFTIDDFEFVDYQCHPQIKAPVAV